MKETQQTISQWANETFGDPVSVRSIATRACLELDELCERLDADDSDPIACVEAADVIIVLMRVFARHGVRFWDAVEAKMAINRARKWRLTGDGHGQHVEEP